MKNKSQTLPELDHSADSQKNHAPERKISPLSADPLHAGLDALFAEGPSPDLLDRALKKLRRRLPEIDPVYYQALESTPLGDLFVAVGHQGLMAVDFGIPETTFVQQLIKITGSPPVPSPTHTAEAAAQIQDYLAGDRDQFDLPIDLEPLTEFQRKVLLATAQIPRGQVSTYGEIARQIGRPGAARAVGQALGKNPIPIVIPCHRVISGDGSLGGYSGGGGLQSKSHLLHLEGAQLM